MLPRKKLLIFQLLHQQRENQRLALIQLELRQCETKNPKSGRVHPRCVPLVLNYHSVGLSGQRRKNNLLQFNIRGVTSTQCFTQAISTFMRQVSWRNALPQPGRSYVAARYVHRIEAVTELVERRACAGQALK